MPGGHAGVTSGKCVDRVARGTGCAEAETDWIEEAYGVGEKEIQEAGEMFIQQTLWGSLRQTLPLHF